MDELSNLQLEEDIQYIQNSTDFSEPSEPDIEKEDINDYLNKQNQRYESNFAKFGPKFQIEVCKQDQKEYINDVSGIYLAEEERDLFIAHFGKCLGHILVMISCRNLITEIYWLSDKKVNPNNQIKDEKQLNEDEIIFRYTHKSRQLVCGLVRIKNQITAVVGQTDGKILFFNPLTSSCDLEIHSGENIVDFIIEKQYLVYITKSKVIQVFNLETEKVVATSQPMEINGSQNCLEIIERNYKGIKIASGNKVSAVQIWQISFSKQAEKVQQEISKMQGMNQEELELKYLHKLNTLTVWNLTVDVLRQFKNSKQNDWQDIQYEQRQFDSSILACGGSFFDASMKYIIQIFNWKTKQLLRNIENGHKGWINSLKFFNDKSGNFIVGSADKNTTVYSALSGQIIKRFNESELVVMHALRMLNLSKKQQNEMNIQANSLCLIGGKDKDSLYLRILY